MYVKVEKVPQIILVVLICIVILVVLKKVSCNKEKFVAAGQSYYFEKEELESYDKIWKNELDYLKTSNINLSNRTFNDSVTILIELRREDVTTSEKLIKEFDKIPSMTNQEISDFLNRTRDFLSHSKNPSRYKDYTHFSDQMINEDKLNLLTANLLKSDSIISVLNARITTVEKLIKEKEYLISELKNRLSDTDNIIGELKKQVTDLNMEVEKIQKEKDLESEKARNSYPVTVEESNFFSPGCKIKKNGSYVINCVDTIKLNFKIVARSSADSIEKIKVVFTCPLKNAGKNIEHINDIDVKLNTLNSIKIVEKPFFPGIYMVQIFLNQKGALIPLWKSILTIKKRFL
jgi:hypothetical protein